jgi:hypothetical protein
MRIDEVIQPNIDKDRLLIEALSHSVSSKVHDYYQDNKSRTKNYTSIPADIFSFPELNSHIIIINHLKVIVIKEIGANSETYKIIEFLDEYFRY